MWGGTEKAGVVSEIFWGWFRSCIILEVELSLQNENLEPSGFDYRMLAIAVEDSETTPRR